MNNCFKIINLLADGGSHSGASIGQQLSISRAAVWKLIKQIEAIGIPVQAVHGKGYQLAHPMELLDQQKIRDNIPAPLYQQLDQIHLSDELGSTNRYLVDYVRAGNNGNHVCLTEHQSQGHGRRNRSWVSPFASGICMSLLWQFDTINFPLHGLSLATAVAVVKALNACDIDDLRLKWPNDILWQQRKLVGVMLEVVGQLNGNNGIVISVGLNTDLSCYHHSISQAIEQPWVDTHTINGKTKQRNRITGHILSELITMLNRYQQQGLTPFLPTWRQLDAFNDQRISLQQGDKQQQGIARGINDDGALILDSDDGKQLTFLSGEVHALRPIVYK